MARRRRPMSAATKAKISAAQKGNKNAYKGGPKKKPGRGDLGGKRNKKTGVKQIRNKGYGKRRAAINLVGAATATTLSLTALRNTKGSTRSGKRGATKRRAVGIGAGAAAGIAAAVHRSHKIGMAKRKAKKNGTVLIVGKRKGKTNAYVPVKTKRDLKKAAKNNRKKIPLQPRKSGKRRAA